MHFEMTVQQSYSVFIEGLYRLQAPSTLVPWNIQSVNVAVRVKTVIHTHDLANSNTNFFEIFDIPINNPKGEVDGTNNEGIMRSSFVICREFRGPKSSAPGVQFCLNSFIV